MKNPPGQLTRYSAGSVQELWAISCPVIFSLLSVNLMIFCDRVILSKYGIQTMNAAMIADLVFNMFQFGAMELVSISEIFVSQFNGARNYRHIGGVIWQMVWFSLASALFFIPLALYGGPHFIPSDYLAEGLPFFKCIMLFGPFFPLHAALASFFIGQGRTQLVMVVTVLSNLLNMLLDFGLIFGIGDIIPSLGVTGAALATGIAQTVQAMILLFIFLRPHHRKIYGTGIWRFKPALSWKIFQSGYPRAILSIVGLAAWSVLSQMVARMSETHITIFSIGDSFYTLFAFSFWGIQRGVIAAAANYIGAGRADLVDFCLKSAMKIILVLVMVIGIPLLFFSGVLFEYFLSRQSILVNEELMNHASATLRWLWVYFTFDAMAWVICGALTAANDTKYVMTLNVISTWLFLLVPIYFCLNYLNSSPDVIWIFCALSSLINLTGFYLRYRTRQWSTVQALHVYS